MQENTIFQKYKTKSKIQTITAVKVTKENIEEISKTIPNSNIVVRDDVKIIVFENKLHDTFLNAKEGEWVCKTDHDGDFYPCKDKVFSERYTEHFKVINGSLFHCNFCGENQKNVKYLISGPGVYICDGCVKLVGEVISDLERKKDENK